MRGITMSYIDFISNEILNDSGLDYLVVVHTYSKTKNTLHQLVFNFKDKRKE